MHILGGYRVIEGEESVDGVSYSIGHPVSSE